MLSFGIPHLHSHSPPGPPVVGSIARTTSPAAARYGRSTYDAPRDLYLTRPAEKAASRNTMRSENGHPGYRSIAAAMASAALAAKAGGSTRCPMRIRLPFGALRASSRPATCGSAWHDEVDRSVAGRGEVAGAIRNRR